VSIDHDVGHPIRRMAVIENEHCYLPPNIAASNLQRSSVYIPKLHESSFSSQAVLKKKTSAALSIRGK